MMIVRNLLMLFAALIANTSSLRFNLASKSLEDAPTGGLAGADASGESPTASASGATPTDSTTGGSSTAETAPAATGTKVLDGKNNATNAVGMVGPSNYSLTAFPYKVKACDQIILVKGEMIKNFTNYCQKSPSYFTMSIYMVNVFSAEQPDKLINSITLDRLSKVPSLLAGVPNCIDFQGSNSRIAVCFDSDATVQKLLEAYNSFLRCRMGDNLQAMSTNQMWKIINDCKNGKKVKVPTTVPKNFPMPSGSGVLPGMEKMLPSKNSTGTNSTSKFNPYYNDLKIPGTR